MRLALVALLLVGCGAAAGPTSAPGRTARPTLPMPSFGGTGTEVCQLMTLADVQSRSPFQTPLTQFAEEPNACVYRSDDDAADKVSIRLEVNNYEFADAANTSFVNARQAAVDAGLPVSDLSDLADVAFASGVDEVGVRAVVGGALVTANMKGEWPDTTDDAKVAAGTELIRTIISRLSP
jgi:hypothetical protein